MVHGKDVRRKNSLGALLSEGVEKRVYPGAVLMVARSNEVAFFHAAGHCSLGPDATPVQGNTIFDLASLTKPLVTATLTRAPGNDAPIGGLKIVTADGWFAARP